MILVAYVSIEMVGLTKKGEGVDLAL